MLYFRNSRARGFTLVELVVVIVILGLLAALATPTFKGVLDRSKVSVESASLQALGRAAAADAAFNQGLHDLTQLELTTEDMGASWSVVGSSSKFGEVSAATSLDAKTLYLSSASSVNDLCINVTVTGNVSSVTTGVQSAGVCTAVTSGSEDPSSPPTPTGPGAPLRPADDIALTHQGILRWAPPTSGSVDHYEVTLLLVGDTPETLIDNQMVNATEFQLPALSVSNWYTAVIVAVNDSGRSGELRVNFQGGVTQ